MLSLETILSHPLLPKDFYSKISKRFAPHVETVRTTARLVSEKYPELKAATIRKADEALKGMFVLPGTGGNLHLFTWPNIQVRT
jgi:hypothetical protein